MKLQTYKELRVWQSSREFVKEIYLLCSRLPKSEQYGLSSQMQRAAVSIPSNIAEGYRRNNKGEYVQFLSISAGSAAELETQIILCGDIYGTDVAPLLEKLDYIQKMLTSLINKLKLDPKP